MHIMTANRGWVALVCGDLSNKIEEAPERYRGPLPSFECQAFIRDCDQAHAEWQERRLALRAEGTL